MPEGFSLYVLHNNCNLNLIVGQAIVVSVMHVSQLMLRMWDRGRWIFPSHELSSDWH